MTHEINLGTFCFQGRYFSAALSMQDDNGESIPFNEDIQTESILKLYRETIEQMLKVYEHDFDLKTPEYIDDDGVKYAEEDQKYLPHELQNKWDILFAAQSDSIRFRKIPCTKNAIQCVVRKFQEGKPLDSLDKLILRYGNGMIHNYRDQETVNDRINQFLADIDS